jgi:cytochrome b
MTPTSANGPDSRAILVWDLPTRAFHWLLVLCFVLAYVTGDADAWLVPHAVFGYTVLGLVGLRLVWGIVGTRYARFASFAYSPKQALGYLALAVTARARRYLGHNPAGSWAIYALLALAVLSSATGWLAIQASAGKWLKELHEGAANAMLAVVLLHVAGVVVSSWLHRENLARSMVTGTKRGVPEAGLRGSMRIAGLVLLIAVGAFWVAALRGDLPALTRPAAEYAKTHHHD